MNWKCYATRTTPAWSYISHLYQLFPYQLRCPVCPIINLRIPYHCCRHMAVLYDFTRFKRMRFWWHVSYNQEFGKRLHSRRCIRICSISFIYVLPWHGFKSLFARKFVEIDCWMLRCDELSDTRLKRLLCYAFNTGLCMRYPWESPEIIMYLHRI